MTGERWQQIELLFDRALEVAPAELPAWLDAQCSGDPELRREIESLLAHHRPEGPNWSAFIGRAAVVWAAPRSQDPDETAGLPAKTPRDSMPAVPSERLSQFLPGAVIGGRYRIKTMLGRGGMGEVYRATDILLDQEVALKFLPQSSDKHAVSRMRHEVKLARQISHPNICKVFDIVELDQRPFVSMEYVDGEDLGSLLHRIGRLPPDKAADTAASLCLGLAAAHAKGVLHRDLKPGNVMLDSAGNVRIVDFGLAALAGRVSDVLSGTPRYMAPEQAAGKEVTEKSDLYSLGVVMYEIFTGRHPEKENRTSFSAEFGIDPAVEEVVERCLEPDPGARPASALAVAVAIPGGNRLKVMVAAGETPSPELIARAGEESSLSVRAALGWLAAALGGLVAYILTAGQIGLFTRIWMPNSPAVLEQKARDVVVQLGHRQPARSSASWFRLDEASIADTERRTGWRTRREALRAMEPSPARFWYRQDPYPLYSLGFGYRGHVTGLEPPPRAGSVLVHFDSHGHLLLLTARPVKPTAVSEGPRPKWEDAFAAAGLDMGAFEKTSPVGTPMYAWDERFAWVQTTAASSDSRIRVEAALQAGRVSYFDWWREPERAVTGSGGQSSTLGMGLLCAVIVVVVSGAGFISIDALRRRRTADVRGSLRLSVFVFAVSAAANGIRMLWGATPGIIFYQVGLALATALLQAVMLFVLYLAIEVFARRRYPWTMIGWARLLAGRWRDPVAGREILIGGAIGVWYSLPMAWRCFDWSFAPLGPGFDLTWLEGPGELIGGMLADIPFSLMVALVCTILFLLIRATWRKTLAVPLLIYSVIVVLPWVWVPDRFVQAILWTAMMVPGPFMLRAGFLAFATAAYVCNVAVILPVSSGIPSWQVPYAVTGVMTIAGLIAFGFCTALGGRRVIPRQWLAR